MSPVSPLGVPDVTSGGVPSPRQNPHNLNQRNPPGNPNPVPCPQIVPNPSPCPTRGWHQNVADATKKCHQCPKNVTNAPQKFPNAPKMSPIPSKVSPMSKKCHQCPKNVTNVQKSPPMFPKMPPKPPDAIKVPMSPCPLSPPCPPRVGVPSPSKAELCPSRVQFRTGNVPKRVGAGTGPQKCPKSPKMSQNRGGVYWGKGQESQKCHRGVAASLWGGQCHLEGVAVTLRW